MTAQAPPPGVRFNPPPGWAVPAGFDPRRGHLPDPAWPTAPADWQFWVVDPAVGRERAQVPVTALPPTADQRRKERVRLALILVGVLFAGFLVFLLGRNDDGGGGVGSCWTDAPAGERVVEVSCGSSRAVWEVTQVVTDPVQCPASAAAYIEGDGDTFLCVRPAG